METVNMMPLVVKFYPEGKSWVGSCPDLDVRTQGETFERAQENLKEALYLFMESCLRRGTLEQVLKEAGLSKVRIRAVVEEANRSVLPYIAKEQNTQCHA